MSNLLQRLWAFHVNLSYVGGKVRFVLLIGMMLTIIAIIIISDSWDLTLPDWVILVVLGVWTIILRTFRSEKDVWDEMEDKLDNEIDNYFNENN
jgi:ABC-type multidrug transport system fused ATPase/permease subunit